MRMLSKLCFVLALAGSMNLAVVEAFVSGAGRCVIGEAAPLHGTNEVSGTLHEGFFSLKVDRMSVFDGDTVTIPVGTTVEVIVSSADPYKGILMQLGMMPDVLVTDFDFNLQPATGTDCTGIAAVTHVDAAPKFRSQMTVQLDDLVKTTLDINIVVSQAVFYHSQISVHVVSPDLLTSPTPAPQPLTPLDPFATPEPVVPDSSFTTVVPDRTNNTEEPIWMGSDTASLPPDDSLLNEDTLAPFAVPALPVESPPPMQSIVDVVQTNDMLTTMAEKIQLAGLEEVFTDPSSSFTLFAPIDQSWNQVPYLDLWLAESSPFDWVRHWRSFISFHMTRGVVFSTELILGESISTVMLPPQNVFIMDGPMEGEVALLGDMTQERGSNIIQANMQTTMGMVHVIDYPIIPTWLTRTVWDMMQIQMSAFAGVVVEAGLEELFSTDVVTVFMPETAVLTATIAEEFYSDDDWKHIVENHVVRGLWYTEKLSDGIELTTVAGYFLPVAERENMMSIFPQLDIDGATMKMSNLLANNGLVHTVDRVLVPHEMLPSETPSAVPSNDPTASPSSAPSEQPLIFETLAEREELSSLVEALERANMTFILQDDNLSFTLFAPVNSAFSASGLETILTDPDWILHLQILLAGHIVEDREIPTIFIRNGEEFETGTGESIRANVAGVTISFDGSAFSGSRIIERDIMSGNGLIHAVDKLMVPSSLSRGMFQAMVLSTQTVSGERMDAFLSVVTLAGMESVISSDSITLFVPSNAAFDEMSPVQRSRILSDPILARDFVDQHIVSRILPTSLLQNDTELISVSGRKLKVVTGEVIQVGTAHLVRPDVVTMNGVIHVIDNSIAVNPIAVDEDVSKQLIDGVSCSFDDFAPVVLPGVTGLSMKNYVDTNNETVSFQLVYPSQGWIGVGFSEDGSMGGSTAVIGLPDANTVKMYDLDGYVLMDVVESEGELLEASVLQTASSTTLEFTQSIYGPNDFVAEAGSSARIIYAVGAMNRLSYHTARSSVEITLNGC